jgi:hypothetical protein
MARHRYWTDRASGNIDIGQGSALARFRPEKDGLHAMCLRTASSLIAMAGLQHEMSRTALRI